MSEAPGVGCSGSNTSNKFNGATWYSSGDRGTTAGSNLWATMYDGGK